MNGLHRIISQYPSIDWTLLYAQTTMGVAKLLLFALLFFFWPSLQSPLYFVQAHRLDEDGDTVSWLITGRGKSPQWKW